jgi:hypothetical protein
MPEGSHRFVGPDSTVLRGLESAVVAAAIREAISMTLELVPEDGRLRVELANSGAGHDFPTGFAFEREVWLEVRAFDQAGRPTFESGLLNPQGRLDTALNGPDSDPYLLLLRSRLVALTEGGGDLVAPDGTLDVPAAVLEPFRNANGSLVLDALDTGAPVREVALQTEADGVLREGIPAGGVRTATYPVPRDTHRVQVRLLMRPFTPATVEDVLGRSYDDIPTYELARETAFGMVPSSSGGTP